MSKPLKKHPKDMTTDEALTHLFHPKIVKHVKEVAANPPKPKRKKATE